MTTIDHKILIPASPQAVWGFISKIDQIPQWQVDCAALSFLSQKRQGVGTRWRYQYHNRNEAVFEISTWYENIGYEYVFIDGGPYKSARGRIRLQEIAEGTFVQWTFTYELGGGMLGELRNTLATQRRINTAMTDSLKTLWKVAKRTNSLEGYHARSLMKDGPQDPDERAQYTSQRTGDGPAIPTLVEPPISDDDTRPRPSLQTQPPAETASPDKPERFQPPAPSYPTLHTPDMPAISDDERRFAPPQPPIVPPAETAPLPDPDDQPTPLSLPAEPAPPPSIDEIFAQMEEIDSPTPPIKSRVPLPTEDDAPPPPPVTPPPAPSEFGPRVSPGTDTSEMSIWEVFGIPSPTDTQRMKAIQAAEEAEAEYEAENQAESTPPNEAPPAPQGRPQWLPRTGLRARKRSNSVKLRRPTPND